MRYGFLLLCTILTACEPEPTMGNPDADECWPEDDTFRCVDGALQECAWDAGWIGYEDCAAEGLDCDAVNGTCVEF